MTPAPDPLTHRGNGQMRLQVTRSRSRSVRQTGDIYGPEYGTTERGVVGTHKHYDGQLE